MDYYNGLRIVESEMLCSKAEAYTVPRTWKERLFSWPWNPWKQDKTLFRRVATDEVIMANGMLVCHPKVAAKLRSVE